MLGLAATSLMLLDKEGMLLPYAPTSLDKVNPTMHDPPDPPQWVGMDVWASARCVNRIEAEGKSLPLPASWPDLTNPAYQGQAAMPNPARRAPAS